MELELKVDDKPGTHEEAVKCVDEVIDRFQDFLREYNPNVPGGTELLRMEKSVLRTFLLSWLDGQF